MNFLYWVKFHYLMYFTSYFKHPPNNAVNKDGYTLTFSDEFNDQAKTESNRWTFNESWSGDNPTIKDGNNPYIIWLREQVKFDYANSMAILKTELNVGTPAIKSGELSTWKALNQCYGWFEVRMKVPPGGIKYWPVFLLYNKETGWLPEVDIAEFDQTDSKGYSTTLHPIDQTVKSPHDFFNLNLDLSNDFHTYALEWTADYLKIYLDNIPLFIAKKYIPNVPLYALICNAINKGQKTLDKPGELYIDYLRIYKTNN